MIDRRAENAKKLTGIRATIGKVIDVGAAMGLLPDSLDLSTSESPRFMGRAVVALAADPDVIRWTGQAVSARDLADDYGFTDVDGSQPDIWPHIE